MLKVSKSKILLLKTPQSVSWHLYVKDIDPAQSHVEFSDTNGSIRFKTRDENFLRQHSTSNVDTLFEWNVDFFEHVCPQECIYRINKSTIEIKLRKKEDSVKWTSAIKRSLEPDSSDQPTVNKKTTTATSSSSSSSPSCSTSSSTTGESAQASSVLPAKSTQVTTEAKKAISVTSDEDDDDDADGDVDQDEENELPQNATYQYHSRSVPIVANEAVQTAVAKPLSPVQQVQRNEMTRSSFAGMTGLVNLGNTCYMNSALQFLVNASTDLRDYFMG